MEVADSLVSQGGLQAVLRKRLPNSFFLSYVVETPHFDLDTKSSGFAVGRYQLLHATYS